jgi:hypothetical protein
MIAKTFKLAVLFADVSPGEYQSQADFSGNSIKILRGTSQSFRGRVISVDAMRIMACFPDTDDACMAAIAMQRKLFGDTGHAARIGVHSGLCLVQGSSIFGEVVDAADALLSLAGENEIVLSEAVIGDALAPVTDRAMPVENPADQALHILPWKEPGSESVDAPVELAPASPVLEATVADIDDSDIAPAEEVLAQDVVIEPAYTPLVDEPVLVLYGVDNDNDNDIDIAADSGVFCVGRDVSLNDWTFAKPIVSRSHFRVEYRDGNYALLDCSTNGTYVTLEGGREVHLKHDEFVLRGSGFISLAVAAGVDPELMIRFELQGYNDL